VGAVRRFPASAKAICAPSVSSQLTLRDWGADDRQQIVEVRDASGQVAMASVCDWQRFLGGGGD
jgi:hypothetical protein